MQVFCNLGVLDVSIWLLDFWSKYQQCAIKMPLVKPKAASPREHLFCSRSHCYCLQSHRAFPTVQPSRARLSWWDCRLRCPSDWWSDRNTAALLGTLLLASRKWCRSCLPVLLLHGHRPVSMGQKARSSREGDYTTLLVFSPPPCPQWTFSYS